MSDRHTIGKYLLIALPLILFSVLPVLAQTPSGAPPTNRVNTERARQQEMSRREYELRNMGKEPAARPTDKRQIEALMAQTEEDFNRILTLHNEIARALKSKDELDYKFVSEAAGEINKRASRVQHSLALGLSPEDAVKPETPKEGPIKDSLIKLCNQIRSFVTNPSIENPNTINAEQMTKARRDLETVIQLSGRIRKDADKLRH